MCAKCVECPTHVRRKRGLDLEPIAGLRMAEPQSKRMKRLTFEQNLILRRLFDDIGKFEL